MGILSKQTTDDLQNALQTEIDQLNWGQKEKLLHVLRRMNSHGHADVEITLSVPQNKIADAEAAALADDLVPMQHNVPGGTVWDTRE